MRDLDKPPLDELAHVGVKGMKWGVRKDGTRTTSGQIRDARKSIDNEYKALGAEHRRTRTKKLQSIDKNPAIAKQRIAYLNNPDRVTAGRLTRGETFILGALGAPAVVAPNPVSIGALGALAGNAASVRAVARRQRTGAYN